MMSISVSDRTTCHTTTTTTTNASSLTQSNVGCNESNGTNTYVMSNPGGGGGGSGGGNGSANQGARTTRLDRKESYKAQRKSYAKEKKRVERELLSTFKDQSIIVLADWLKVRGTLKGWTKLWCILKPGLLLLYRSPKAKSSHWVGTIILSTCELIERPSKKDGYCFKLFHPMDQSIWAARGPDGEALGAVVQPLPSSHAIFRAPNSAAGRCWMDALELALRCSSLLLRTMSSSASSAGTPNVTATEVSAVTGVSVNNRLSSTSDSGSVSGLPLDASGLVAASGELDKGVLDEMRACASDLEDDDFDDEDLDDEDSCSAGGHRRRHTDSKGEESDYSEDAPYGETVSGNNSSGSSHEKADKNQANDDLPPVMTPYVKDPSGEVFGTAKDQTEEISDENKSIVWFLVKQVRPGMDLSKVVLPTFILEPRSFLQKISDYYYHSDLLSQAVKEEEPFARMKTIVRWYLSGFYKKPKGLKKPYNPILGETFRCYWEHPNGSKTYYIAEQVSHHPPISANFVSNRQDGFSISATILAKSKFYGNSTSAILEGEANLCLLPRGEDYTMTLPYAHCKGILMGTMTLELGGKVSIECSKTGYATELEFKLRPFLGGGEFTNAISGKIRLGKETLVTIDGHWDDCVMMKDKRTGKEEVLWKVTDEIRASRLKRYIVPIENQGIWESERLWNKVSDAIKAEDQTAATEEKSALEEAQRARAREHKANGTEHESKYFEKAPGESQYYYRHADLRPWDPMNDLYQYERDYKICTKTKHKTPLIRTQSIVSVSDTHGMKSTASGTVVGASTGTGSTATSVTSRRRKGVAAAAAAASGASNSASTTSALNGDASQVVDGAKPVGHSTPLKTKSRSGGGSSVTASGLESLIQPLEAQQRHMNERLAKLQHTVDVMNYQQRERDSNSNLNRDMVMLVILVVMIQAMLNWVLSNRAQSAAAGYPPPPGPQDPI